MLVSQNKYSLNFLISTNQIKNLSQLPNIKKLTLNFVGVKKVKFTTIGSLRLSKDNYRKKWLDKIEKLGKKKYNLLFYTALTICFS